MLMSKRVAWLGVRMLILPLHHAAGVPSITLGSKEPQEPGFCWICCQRLLGLAGVFLPPRPAKVYTFAVACCSSLWSLSGSSEAAKQSLLQGCRRSSPGLFLASAAAQLPLFLQPRHFHRHRLGVKLLVLNCQRGLPIPAGAGLSWASYKRVESGKWGGSGPSTPTAVPERCQGK